MKKKFLVGVVIAAMAIATVACGSKGDANSDNKKEDTAKVEIKSSDELINKVFDAYAEDEKFAMMGGDIENVVDGKAGIYNMEDKEGLLSTAHISENLAGKADEVATAVHMMNANNFTAVAIHLKDASASDAFVKDLETEIMGTQWICGFPEKIVMYTVDEYVVYVVGAADLVDNFAEKFDSVYKEAATEILNKPME